jgi:hypothetical protein
MAWYYSNYDFLFGEFELFPLRRTVITECLMCVASSDQIGVVAIIMKCGSKGLTFVEKLTLSLHEGLDGSTSYRT